MEFGQILQSDNPQQTTAQNPPQRNNQEVYKFSPDELRVLKQCNVESFYQRCLPIGTFMGVGTYYAVKSGYLSGHTRFGAAPKICAAVIAGYFLGKLSYQQKCAQKLMALPNSRLGELLRQRKRQGINENISLDGGFSSPLNLDPPAAATIPQAPRQSYLDMDSDRPYMGDYERPPQDESYDVSEIPVPPGGVPSTSYEELRKRNREEYDTQRNKLFGYGARDRESDDVPAVVRAPSPPAAAPRKPKNKYGDEWE